MRRAARAAETERMAATLSYMPTEHVPVLAAELIAVCDPKPGERAVDCTFGGGGHARLVAERLGSVDARLWPRWRTLVEYLETVWEEPDDGIWEARGPRRHFTHSKVMAWLVFDSVVRVAERYGLEAPVERWKKTRARIHEQVCERGYDRERRTFTQYYGSKELDASTLLVPLVGFLPGDDERVTGTIDAVRASWGEAASCHATRPTRRTTGCRAARGGSSRARSGSSWRLPGTAGSTRRAPCSSACSV